MPPSTDFVSAVVRRLRGSDEQAPLAAAQSLARLAQGGTAQQDAIAAAGGIAALLRCLRDCCSEQLRAAAADALGRAVESNPSNQQAVLEAGGPALLVSCLADSGTGVTPLQGKAALAIVALSKSRAACDALVAAGCIPALVQLTRRSASGSDTDSPQVQRSTRWVVGALFSLAEGLPSSTPAIVAASALPALFALLEAPAAEHLHAVVAAAVNQLVLGSEGFPGRQAAAETCDISSLVSLLCRPPTPGMPCEQQARTAAALALASLADGASAHDEPARRFSGACCCGVGGPQCPP